RSRRRLGASQLPGGGEGTPRLEVAAENIADAAVRTYEGELAAARAKSNAIGSAARDAATAKAEEERRAVEASLSE
ncbi:hypothetical protein AB9E26_37415, partial [Rhizobium leguminosarum]